MGRLESLTALALGRGHYEEEVIIDQDFQNGSSTQQYNDRGYPRNPETKRMEREQVRAANEVMQITGVVEDSLAARVKASQQHLEKTAETYTGLRLMEVGRAVLVGGVWGVLGLRRRILLYKSYSEDYVPEILRRERMSYSIAHIMFAGFPTVIAYHGADWLAFVAETVLDATFSDEEEDLSLIQNMLKSFLEISLDVGFCYITLHFRMFALLQQLNLVSTSRLLPSWSSFIPFSAGSTLQLPPSPSLTPSSLLSWGVSLLQNAAPLIVILAHGKLKYMVSRVVYRPIYKLLPRPTGESMFSGLAVERPTAEYDTPDQHPEPRVLSRSEDEPTLRALEGLPTLERTETRTRYIDRDEDTSDEEEDEMTHATLISFDVEPTEVVETSTGQWSAELRSANEPKPSEESKYRVTGMTMLPTIMATEGLREIVAGILVMPVEAFMVRFISRAYRRSAGLGTEDFHPVGFLLPAFGNLFSVLTIQLAVTGLAWTGFTLSTQLWSARQRKLRKVASEKENS